MPGETAPQNQLEHAHLRAREGIGVALVTLASQRGEVHRSIDLQKRREYEINLNIPFGDERDQSRAYISEPLRQYVSGIFPGRPVAIASVHFKFIRDLQPFFGEQIPNEALTITLEAKPTDKARYPIEKGYLKPIFFEPSEGRLASGELKIKAEHLPMTLQRRYFSPTIRDKEARKALGLTDRELPKLEEHVPPRVVVPTAVIEALHALILDKPLQKPTDSREPTNVPERLLKTIRKVIGENQYYPLPRKFMSVNYV